MSVEYICDGCSKREPGDKQGYKPQYWFVREDDDGKQYACSRECINKIAESTGKTKVILPW